MCRNMMVVVDDEGEHPLAGACCSAIALPSNAVGRNACRLSLIGQCQCRTNKMSYFIEKKNFGLVIGLSIILFILKE